VLVGVGVSYAEAPHQAAVNHSSAPYDRQIASSPLFRVSADRALSPLGRYDSARVRLGEAPSRIKIPALGINSPVIPTGIIDGVWQTADWAVGYMDGSAEPGRCTVFHGQQTCGTDLAAHDDIKGEIFKRLGDLHNGAKVFLYTKHTVLTYVVGGQQTVDNTDSGVLFSPVKALIMVTCAPYWQDYDRLVVTAVLIHARPRRKA